ncbi:hypothetical protein FWJ25_17105 [Marinobacter salinexigens]|uniref:Uncharacterized protein n=1 Tax=Marinobacter salinexigens TaxID=2919747 RepID=A0A5B0VAD2_9GAMM|nr:hypothetical protein [Marinobacter salinexigens]KAA1171125.1 hypothetical protein FWJ25_17105 [Marinobacter salinexigens]
MSDSPLNCDLPVTDIEQQLEKRWYRTHGERLASPPARKVAGAPDSSEDMSYGIAYINDRFMDIRTAFLIFRRFQLVVINLFMIAALSLMWVVGQFYYGVFAASAALFVPLWAAVYLFEIFFPLTLPVRVDRQEGFVYVGHRGTFYRIPWDELEVSFSHNLQYLGSGVMWERQYYSHLYLRDKYYFCGKAPKRPLQRKKISSGFNEDDMYRKWNFIVRYYNEGFVEEDKGNLVTTNYDSYIKHVGFKSLRVFLIDHFVFVIFMPTFIWWKFSPFKFKWPKEIEAVFGKINYY